MSENYITTKIDIEGLFYPVLIGKNAKGNEEIIKMSNQEDTWFHLENLSSPHIILKNEGDIIPKRYINQVASMLFEYKKNAPRNSNVIYTQVKNVKLTNVLGTVIPRNTKLIKF